MDDALELPSAAVQKLAEYVAEDNDQEGSDDEDGGLDWTKLLYEPPRPLEAQIHSSSMQPSGNASRNSKTWRERV